MDRPDENRDSGGTPPWLNRMLAAGNPGHRENFFRVGSVDGVD